MLKAGFDISTSGVTYLDNVSDEQRRLQVQWAESPSNNSTTKTDQRSNQHVNQEQLNHQRPNPEQLTDGDQEEQCSEFKKSDMSFSDWKKYKTALTQPQPPPPPPPQTKQPYNNYYAPSNNFQMPLAPDPQFVQADVFNQYNAFQGQMMYPPPNSITSGNNVTKRSFPETSADNSSVNAKSLLSNTDMNANSSNIFAKPVQNNRLPKTVEPQIYVHVTKPTNTFGSNWIKKPPIPPPMDAVTPESKEEKQRMWKEYRQAMKPFKNREFANAKRTIQRLGKKNISLMDEKEIVRLQRAQETVSSHKMMLSQKAAKRWVRIQDMQEAASLGLAPREPPTSETTETPVTDCVLKYNMPSWKSPQQQATTLPPPPALPAIISEHLNFNDDLLGSNSYSTNNFVPGELLKPDVQTKS